MRPESANKHEEHQGDPSDYTPIQYLYRCDHLCKPSDGDLHMVLLDLKCFQVKTGVLRMAAVYDIPAHN